MLFDAFDQVNWLAVVVATVAYIAIATVWYSDAVFGKQWRAAAGIEERTTPEVGVIVANLVLWFVAALVLALIAQGIGADDVGDGVVLGLAVSFGFIGTNRVVTDLYEGSQRGALARINAPLTLIGFAVMGVILATWT